ncbi:nitrate- and nitrite sensing domain-containing protein [Streptomyces sp. INA 01156]
MAALRPSRSSTADWPPAVGSSPSTPRTRTRPRTVTAANDPAAPEPHPRERRTRPRSAEAPEGSRRPGSRMALRNWRISTRLVSLLALPVVAATSLGGLRISQSMDDIQQLDNMKLLTDITQEATELAAALQEERDQSACPLAHGGKATDFGVKGHREKTDRARKNFLDSSEEINSASQDGDLKGIRDNLVQLAGDLGDLEKIRNTAYVSKDNSTQTVEGYHRLIENLIDLSQDMAEATSNPEMIQRTRALASFSAAKEYASIQRAVLAAALPAGNDTYGNLSENDRLYAESALESQKSELRSFRSIYGEDKATELLLPIEDGNAIIKAADKYAGRALVSDDGLESMAKRSYRDWLDDSSTKIQQMKNVELRLLEEMEQKARELRSATERDAIISGALILLVLGVSLIGAFVVARSMIRSLRRRGHRDQGRPGTPARAGQAAVRVRPAGRRHVRGVGRCALPGRDRPGGRGLRRRAPRGGPPRRRAGPAAGQRQRDVHQPLAPLPGSDPAPAVADLRTGVPRGRPGPAVLAVQAGPPRHPHAP